MHCYETYQRRVKYSACLRNDAYFEADRSCKGSRAWCLRIVKHVPNMKKWRVTTRVAYGHNMPHDNTWHGFHSMMFHQSWYCIADRLLVRKEDDLNCPMSNWSNYRSTKLRHKWIHIRDWYLMIFEGFLKWGYPQFSSIFVGFLWIFLEINHPAIGVPHGTPFQMTLPISASFHRYSEVLCTVCASW